MPTVLHAATRRASCSPPAAIRPLRRAAGELSLSRTGTQGPALTLTVGPVAHMSGRVRVMGEGEKIIFICKEGGAKMSKKQHVAVKQL